MPAPATQSRIWASSSSSNPKRARTGAVSARSSTSEAVTRLEASSSSRAVTPRTGWCAAASGRRAARAGPGARRRCAPPGSSSARPRGCRSVASISGANASMSGHITITSRGSSVGSSASRCRIASRSTSTWRARPWQAWTRMLWSSRPSSQPRVIVAVAKRRLRAAGDRRGYRPAGPRSSVSRRLRLLAAGDGSIRADPREQRLEAADVTPPGGEQPVPAARRCPTSPARGAAASGAPRGRSPAPRGPAGGWRAGA